MHNQPNYVYKKPESENRANSVINLTVKASMIKFIV